MNLWRQLLFPTHSRTSAGKRGQTLVIFAFFFFALVGVVGLAADGGIGYFYSVQLEKAVSAAALAGVPYMPGNPGQALIRARAEAARNGFTAANSTLTAVPTSSGNFKVRLTTQAPTYFMAALGVQPYPVVRIAEAGYRPPISIGQPNPNLGSTVPALSGGGGNFYFLRFKGWNNDRSEGDAFTPNPGSEVSHNGGTGSASSDVHLISQAAGNETSAVFSTDQTGASTDGTCAAAVPGAFPLPCRGGYNYRIVVPSTVATGDVEVDVYNMAYAPDTGNKNNVCDNQKNWPTCNVSGYGYNENDSGSGSCTDPASCNRVKSGYLATKYSVFSVPDVGLRSNDVLLTQTTVLPIDATNWDCNNGSKGAGNCSGATNPTYMNVNTGVAVTQAYVSNANGADPTNMRIYHNWADVVNYTGAQDGGLVNHVYAGQPGGCTASPCNVNGGSTGLGPGTYRVRADALQYDGTIGTTQRGSKGYAIRAIHKGTGAACTECTVAAWQDICIYSPVGTAGNSAVNSAIPLFELTPEYAGSTINVDIFDVGDGGDDGSGNGTVDVGLLDPTTTPANQLFTAATGLAISNLGINESGALPLLAHTAPQSPDPDSLGPLPATTTAQYRATDYAGYTDSNGASGPRFQGSWIRVSMPVPSSYAQKVQAYPNDFWSLQYSLRHVTMNDTFTMSVSASGGPVRLLSS